MSQFYLVAPSGYCINQQAAARGVERLQQAGHTARTIRLRPGNWASWLISASRSCSVPAKRCCRRGVIPRRQQRFAGTEHERLADINQLAQLPGRNRIVRRRGPPPAG
jgi:muramoyltetrapeptide carboxypeptidase